MTERMQSMKKYNVIAGALALSAVLVLSGCGSNNVLTVDTTSLTSVSSDISDSTSSSGKITAAASSSDTSAAEATALSSSELFTERDLEQTADQSDAVRIEVEDGQTYNITEAGVYVISGTAEDCTIRVEAADTDKVQLVLDGVSITNSDFPAIYAVQADKVFITTTDSENSLSVTGEFTADGDTNTDAVIFSKDDLVLNGTGTLTVYSAYGNGITSKDDLKVTGGTYNIASAADSLEANDSILICDGTFTINTNKDGLHCENDEQGGEILITGGSFNISAKSDGIRATTILRIDGGDFNISASEGLESTFVQINGGTIYIESNDDGINASAKSSAYDVAVEFNGGDTTIVMSSGDVDGVDSNGSIYVNGGTVNISITEQGMAEAFDFDQTGEINGGTVYVNGEQITEITSSMMPGGGMGGGGMQGGGPGGMGGGHHM